MRSRRGNAGVAILAAAMLLVVGAAGAQATVALVEITGTTLTVIGSAGDDAPKLRACQLTT